MTDTATKQRTKGLDMVDAEISYELKTAKVSCPTKSKSVFTVSTAPGGFIFYEVKNSDGRTPEQLSGRFTGLDKAVAAVTDYFEKMPKTKAVKLQNNRKRREDQKNATADHTKGSK